MKNKRYFVIPTVTHVWGNKTVEQPLVVLEGETPPARPSPGRGARSWLRLLGQLIRYGLFGSLGALTDFLVYSMLIGWLGVAVLVANVFGVLSGITVSFLLNSRLTFVQTDHRALRALRFLTVGLTGMGLSTLLCVCLYVRYVYTQ